MLFSIIFNYFGAILIDKDNIEEKKISYNKCNYFNNYKLNKLLIIFFAIPLLFFIGLYAKKYNNTVENILIQCEDHQDNNSYPHFIRVYYDQGSGFNDVHSRYYFFSYTGKTVLTARHITNSKSIRIELHPKSKEFVEYRMKIYYKGQQCNPNFLQNAELYNAKINFLEDNAIVLKYEPQQEDSKFQNIIIDYKIDSSFTKNYILPKKISWYQYYYIIENYKQYFLFLTSSFILFLLGFQKIRNLLVYSCLFIVERKKLLLGIIISINILSLVIFKYTGFLINNVNSLFNISIKNPKIVLPIGISFYTFQILSYIIDVYRKEIPVQKNIIKLATYISLFPQLIAGPIIRYKNVADEIDHRKETLELFVSGVRRFIIGLGKKVIIANNMAIIADLLYDNIYSLGTGSLWLAAITYTLQIYFDFSGYSDMAIGLGKMFGFHFLENFNYPYISNSITDFWKRWHISLSSWFKDYVYIPLGGNRCSKLKHIRNILIVWMITGLWHGASWNFVLWGLYYGILLIIEKYLFAKLLVKMPKFLKHIYALLLVIIGWVIFRVENFQELTYALKNMFYFKSSHFLELLFANTEILYSIIFMIIAIFASIPLYKKFTEKANNNKLL